MTDVAGSPIPPEGDGWKWWDTETTATAIGVKRNTLYVWRHRGGVGPPYYRFGSALRYRSDEVMHWLRSRRHPGDGTVEAPFARGINGKFIRYDAD